MSEYILCAAIWFDDGKKYELQPKNIQTGFVIAGRRHSNCFGTLSAIREANDKKHFEYGESTQGFITNRDRFVNREEAMHIAYEAHQVDFETTKSKRLFSEDLY